MKTPFLRILVLSAIVSSAWAAPSNPVVDVYKSPTCGCCGKWIEHMQASGFQVKAHDTNDVAAQKTRLGLPVALGSCHTAEVAGYLIEGHVPAREIKRLLKERPAARGLTAPGMPQGAPGMEQGSKDHYDVLLIKRDGSTQVYAHY